MIKKVRPYNLDTLISDFRIESHPGSTHQLSKRGNKPMQHQPSSHSSQNSHSSTEGDHDASQVHQASVSRLESSLGRLSSQNGPIRDVESSAKDETNQGPSSNSAPSKSEEANNYTQEAQDLVRTFTGLSSGYPQPAEDKPETSPGDSDGGDTPIAERHIPDVDYVPAPKQYKPSVFGALLNSKLNALQPSNDSEQANQGLNTSQTPASPTSKPGKGWYEHLRYAKSVTKDKLSESASSLSATSGSSSMDDLEVNNQDDLEKGLSEQQSSVTQDQNSEQNNVVAEVADILVRRHFLIKLCESFMKYGAPTHRLEDYLRSAARALEIDAVFMYIPGTMNCTFRDSTLQTNTTELIRGREGLDFSRLKDTFDVYKKVIHETPNANERKTELDSIENRPDEHSIWLRILLFGISSVLVGPFSFQARPIDFIPIFFLGCALGFLQLKVVPRSDHFSNVFEVTAAVVIAFAARGLGSIRVNDEYLFCFSATAQSGIALILPGFMILNSALELQGQSMVAGSVRMIYSVIYVLFLGFGLLLGMTLYGLMDRNAVTDTTCHVPTWFAAEGAKLLYTNFVWVPLFACSLALIYGARWSQMPVMAFISVCGYQAYYWMYTVLQSNPQIANAVGAFVIGCIANIYSRVFKGPAATNMLPAIYCLVPGGLATSGSLVAGVQSSEDIVSSSGNSGASYSNTVFSVGSNAIQICIGTSVGLYLSALVVYPYGKRRSGLFSFS